MTTSYHDLLGWSPEAVVFDCDGALMDSERHWQEARSRAFREHGLLPPSGAQQALGLFHAAALRPTAAGGGQQLPEGRGRRQPGTGRAARTLHLVVPDAGDHLRPKPHPDVYAVPARLCGLPAHRALAVEDSLTGVEAPARRGRSPPRPGAWRRRLRG
ncbi:hydrolase [Streptomyces geysiriensis]|nr:hydrolase [Streptomyces geysiriensis]GHC43588.1 hydrolase [Streptomyces vinaceusdrappus]